MPISDNTHLQHDPVHVFLTERDLADRHRLSVKALQSHRSSGKGVPFIKLGRSVRYRLSDVLAWEEAHLHTRVPVKGARYA